MTSFEEPGSQKKSEKPPIVTPKPSSSEIVRRLSLNQTENMTTGNLKMISKTKTMNEKDSKLKYNDRPCYDVIRYL